MSALEGDQNFAAELFAAATSRLNAPFLVSPQQGVATYGEFYERVRRYAGVLTTLGAKPGDRVLVQVPKSCEAVALYVACLWAGTVHVPLNPAFTPTEVDYFVRDSEPSITVLGDGLDANGQGWFTDLAVNAAPLDRPVERSHDDLAALLYTSGTTGRPKGAALSHASLHHNANALSSAWRFSDQDHLVHGLPIFHVHGLFVALHCAMLAAIPVTFLPRFDAGEVIGALNKATVFMGVPTHYRRLLDHPDFGRDVCRSMRLFTAGSAPLAADAFAEFAKLTGHRICERYGMSETGITVSNPYDGERRAGTVGYPVAGIELKVVDQGGDAVAAGAVGTVCVRGAQLMREYWRRPDATAEAYLEGEWFMTGDVGSLDETGRLSLHGRSSDMIISGGENIYPKEIETVLDAVPGVTESAVIGIPDLDFGEVPLAVIATEDDGATYRAIQDAVEAALNSSLARFKHPRRFVTVRALPRNSMGKVQKNVLRVEYGSNHGANSKREESGSQSNQE